MNIKSILKASIIGIFVSILTACGGGGGGGDNNGSNTGNNNPSTPTVVDNQTNLVIDQGPILPNNTYPNAANVIYTTVTVCQQGTTDHCIPIDHVLVDTGSTGLRLLASAVDSTVWGNSPYATQNGQTMAECMQFADGYTWGTIKKLDIKVSNETATNIPVQIIGDYSYTGVPTSCANTGGKAENDLTTLGAKGIIGIGYFKQDCGSYCEQVANNTLYYTCDPTNTANCTNVAVPVAQQVVNPVSAFPQDNNGSTITLNSAGAPQATGSGTLTFGVGTRDNNGITSGQFYQADSSGTFKVTYKGVTQQAIVDSGSSVFFFSDPSIPTCSQSGFAGFYCPASVTTISSLFSGYNGNNATINFNIDNAQNLYTNYGSDMVQPTLSASSSSFNGSLSGVFDLGSPFFYGRSVTTVIEGGSTSKGTGPGVVF